MGSRLKRHKHLEEALGKAGEASDRISSLPDSVLCHILSFLTTKSAVRTSILSTRWKYLFASTPNLDFDDSLHLHPEDANYRGFVKFVYRVLVLRNTLYINRFRLKSSVEYDTSDVNAWICAALWRNVQELDLQIYMTEAFALPYDLFSCRTLVVLKLDLEFDLLVPTKVWFPSLKTLHLQSLFLNNNSIGRLFSGCPVLEDLRICDCGLGDVRVIDISVATLKSLAIKCSYESEYRAELCQYEVVVDGPCLEYLKYIDYMAKGYTVKNLNSLVEAHISVALTEHQVSMPRLNSYCRNIHNLVEGISAVKFLYLSGESISALDVTQCCLPTFPHLTRLELGANYNVAGWELLPKLLESSPHLEVLVFPEGFIDDNGFERGFEYRLPEHVPSCLSLHLQQVEISSFTGEEDELELVEYFLKSAKVLKKMTINHFMSSERELCISKKLLMFPRRSKACQIMLT